MAGIFERGTGQPIVLVPGIQGRWEWMAPTIDALAAYGRAITFSLCDEPTSGFTWDQDARLRELPRATRRGAGRHRRVAAGAGRRVRTAVWSPPSSPPGIRSGWPGW